MSARIEDVLAEHADYGQHHRSGQWECECGVLLGTRQGCEEMRPRHLMHQADMLREAGFGDVAQARKDEREAIEADVRRHALWPAEHAAVEWVASIIRARAAEDSPAPVDIGDGGARPEAGGEASSPDVMVGIANGDVLFERELPAAELVDCEDCGETVRHSACSHGKDMCPGCWPGLCHGCQADSAELCGDASKAGDVL